jgi:hypothetical protein
MKIYFEFTVAGGRSSVVAATKIVKLLEELGHDVLTRHLIREGAWQADRSVSPQEVYQRAWRGFSSVICLWLKFRAPHSAWVLSLATF